MGRGKVELISTAMAITSIEKYESLIGVEATERILRKAAPLMGARVACVNSTYYGGGVSEILDPLTLLFDSVGISVEWRVIMGSPDFFSITKKMHNALQGDRINLSLRKKRIYERTTFENAVRNQLDHDYVIVHDPQPLALIEHYSRKGPWIWHCHPDMSQPNPEIWSYLRPFVDQYQAAVFSIPEYRQELDIPQLFVQPAIDPFSIKNRKLDRKVIADRLRRYGIPTDLPLVAQVSRFDRWKDPEGVIESFRLARKRADCTLVLLGDVATDDPEGEEVYRSLLGSREERIIILSRQDSALVNALQQSAAVILQKSIKEGFGITVSEALWKGTPVIGGNVGGIPYQIKDGVNGFLVSTIEEAADRIVRLLQDSELRRQMGQGGRRLVKEKFLMSRLLEDYLDLLGSFETVYRMKQEPPARPAGG